MIYQICALLILLFFYTCYLGKIIIQKKQSIKTNQVGTGNKTKKVATVEIIMSFANTLNVGVEIISIFLTPSKFLWPIKVLGIALGIIAVIFFGRATADMKNNWRVGIPEEKTNIVTNGIYKLSRNPAFVGFDLLYISILLLSFNIPLLLISVWAMIMLHFQILQEEEWLGRTFGEEFEVYRSKVCRYLGRKI